RVVRSDGRRARGQQQSTAAAAPSLSLRLPVAASLFQKRNKGGGAEARSLQQRAPIVPCRGLED
ncbi:unnamed protein product, partial [Musa textilis]